METIVCEIAKSRMKKDFNEALNYLGLFVTSVDFYDSEGLLVVVEISANEGVLVFI